MKRAPRSLSSGGASSAPESPYESTRNSRATEYESVSLLARSGGWCVTPRLQCDVAEEEGAVRKGSAYLWKFLLARESYIGGRGGEPSNSLERAGSAEEIFYGSTE